MSAITDAISTVVTVVGGVFDMITDNPLLVVFVAIGLVGAGIGLFKKLKGSAK